VRECFGSVSNARCIFSHSCPYAQKGTTMCDSFLPHKLQTVRDHGQTFGGMPHHRILIELWSMIEIYTETGPKILRDTVYSRIRGECAMARGETHD